jgi:endonuclease YncB( thermonuclease family)
LGIWSEVEGREFTATNFEGVCQAVGGPLSLLLVNGDERRPFFFTCLKLPYFVNPAISDPWGFEVREFLRLNFVRKHFRAVVTGPQYRDYALLFADGICLNEVLLGSGLATLTEPYIGPKPDNWAQMQAAENVAKQRRIGIWSDHQPDVFPVLNLIPVTAKPEAAQKLPILRENRCVGILERVKTANQFEIYLPALHILMRARLNGVMTLDGEDRSSIQAKSYCQAVFNQSTVEVSVFAIDMSGGFLANIAVLFPIGERMDIAEDLVGKGLVDVHRRASHGDGAMVNLVRLQNSAKQGRLGIWSDGSRHNREMVVGREEEVRVVSIWDPITLTIQFTGSDIDKIQRGIREPLSLLSKPPMKHDVVVIQIVKGDTDVIPYRARIEEISSDSPKATVDLVDFGQVLEVEKHFFECPRELIEIEPQARTVTLGCLELLDRSEEAIEAVWNVCHNSVLYAHLMYEEGKTFVLITDAPPLDSGSLNAFLLSKHIAKFAPHLVPRPLTKIVETFKAF